MSDMTEDDYENARLVLMEFPDCTLTKFAQELRKIENYTLVQCSRLWERYRGFDDRIRPTHSIETGKRL